jgi:ribosome modulation factor
MSHYRLRDLREKWNGGAGGVIYLPPPAAAESRPKINRTKKAYDAGYAARQAGSPQQACPHNAIAAHKRYAAWRMGWSQADREASAVEVRRPEHPVGYVPGVWKDMTTPFAAAILAYSPAGKRKTSRQKVADWCRNFRSKSGWKASDGRRPTGGALIIS